MDFRIVDGRLTKDSEIKKDSRGLEFLTFTLANNGFANGTPTTTFFRVVSYNKHDLDKKANYTKGKFVIVSGRPNESMTIKDGYTYLNRNIMADRIEGGASNSTKEESSTNVYQNVAPSTPTVETPHINTPTSNTIMNQVVKPIEKSVSVDNVQNISPSTQQHFEAEINNFDDNELPF